MAEVSVVTRLSPSIVRVELCGSDIEQFESSGVPDEACCFVFPVEGVLGPPDRERMRWYTVRHHDSTRGRMTVDLVTHPGGIGAGWARAVAVGDQLSIARQGDWYKRPAGARWQVLLGDVAALPAIGRIIEERPAGLRTIALIEVPDPADEQHFDGVEVTWLHNRHLATSGSRLAEAARALTLPTGGPGYIYVAGEAAATRDIRQYLRRELALPAGTYGVVGYWRLEAESYRRRVATSAVDLESLWEASQVGAADEEEALDRYEQRLAQVDLL